MKVNLVKELEKSLCNKKNVTENNDVLKEVKGLLEYDGLRDLQMLRSIGARSTLVQSEEEKGRVLEIEKQEQFLSGKIFTKEQIITLATKYRLKFLQSQYYTKYIPPSIVPEIRDMERHISGQMSIDRAKKENLTIEEYITKTGGVKYSIDDTKLGSNFYVLAPASMFKTEKTAAFTIQAKDPVMFYTEDHEHFRLVKKWGTDFTIFRRVLGWLTMSTRRHIWTLYVMPILLIIAFLSVKYSLGFLALLAIPGIAAAIIFGMMEFKVNKHFAGRKHVDSHNSFYM